MTGAGRSIATWLDLCRCARRGYRRWTSLRECPLPTLVWVFADREGHIGMQASGWFPKRGRNHHGLLPIPAWDKRNHWRGLLSSSVLPRGLRSAGRLRGHGQREHQPAGRPDAGHAAGARLSQAADRRAAGGR